MTFAETMATNPPRLVVLFQRDDQGSERFQWGMVGSMPILGLIGAVARAQVNLITEVDYQSISDGDVEHPAFVLAWDPVYAAFARFLHPDIPVDPLVGMLETIKATLVGSRLGQHAAAQVRVLGPDGNPMGG